MGPSCKFQTESVMREERIKKNEDGLHYCGVGCSYDVWTKDRKILKISPLHGETIRSQPASKASLVGIL